MNQKGMTLIELIIAVGIVGVGFGALGTFLTVQMRQVRHLELERGAYFELIHFSEHLKKSMISSNAPPTLIFDTIPEPFHTVRISMRHDDTLGSVNRTYIYRAECSGAKVAPTNPNCNITTNSTCQANCNTTGDERCPSGQRRRLAIYEQIGAGAETLIMTYPRDLNIDSKGLLSADFCYRAVGASGAVQIWTWGQRRDHEGNIVPVHLTETLIPHGVTGVEFLIE